DRVFVRTEPRIIRRKTPRTSRRLVSVRPDKVVYVASEPPPRCPECRRRKISKAGCEAQTIVDLVFTRKGVRRQVTKERIQRYRCIACGWIMGVPKLKSRTRTNLQAYIIYLLIEMRLSNSIIAKHLRDIFGIPINKQYVHTVKERVASELEPLYKIILN